jgi:chloramphenicol-sensitive protein RarD
MPQSSGDPETALNAAFVRNGVLSGVLAFSMWGAFPIYFKIADGVSALEMLAHRIVWAVPFGALIILMRRQWPQVRTILGDRRTLGLLCVSAAFITVNWLVYIWAVQNEQIFQASLGYYINPLLLVVAGYLFLGERLRRLQSAAVVLAAGGVAVLAISGAQFPFIALTLAASFTVYGLVRKRVVVGAMPGLFIETLVLLPIAAVYLWRLIGSGAAAFGTHDLPLAGLLLLAGPLTVLPLLFFAIAARRLRLATIGFLQFIGPTGQFLIGVYYGEPLSVPHMVCFGMIWTAVAVFVFDAVRPREPVRNPAGA